MLYPVDILMTFNGDTAGNAATKTTLTSSIETVNTGTWETTIENLTFAAPFAPPLPGSITVNGVGSHDCGYAGQSIAADDGQHFYLNSFSLANQVLYQTAVVSGYFTSGPTTGGYDSLVVGLVGYPVGQAIQIGLMTDGTSCTGTNHIHMHNSGNTSALCIPISSTPTYYYFTWLLDGSSPSATTKFKLCTDATCATSLGEIDYQLRYQVITAAYTSGGSISGSATQTCIVTFDGTNTTPAKATVALTGTNTIAGGTSMGMTDFGTGIPTAPTTATLTNGTATCSGTATVSTTQPGTLTLANIQIGNNESSTQAGKTTNWQWLMVDYTNHVWPNILH